MKRKGQIIIGLALILIFILMALAAPVLAPNDPNATNLALKNAPPSAEYPLGCDQMGRCELSRLLYGARYSMGLTIPVLIVLAAFALFVGCYSSYKGGLLDEVMRILCDILMAFPLIVIAMALVSAVDNSVASVIIAIGISMLAWFLRMVRSYAKTECGKEYIEAARIAGASGLRIVLRHLIPNVFPQFVVYFTTGIATAIMSVSSFAFLGVGLIAGTPEWGAMLNEARNSVYSNPALLIYPGICLTFFSRDLPYCDVEQTVYGFDLDHANQILDEAGYVDTDGDGIREKDGVKLSAAFMYQTGTASDDNMVVYICDQASKIGIELTPQSAQMMDWYAMIQSGDYGLTIFKTQGGYYDPAMVITNINPSTSMDPILMQIGASQPELAALVDELDSATDEARIQEIYNTILTTMADQCLTTPLIYTRQLAIYSDAVASYTFPTDASFTSVQNIHLN